MRRKLLQSILWGSLGFLAGFFTGGYLGLVVGGTFLGGLEIYEHIGLEGYELASYVGAVIGGPIVAALGIKHALKVANKKVDKI